MFWKCVSPTVIFMFKTQSQKKSKWKKKLLWDFELSFLTTLETFCKTMILHSSTEPTEKKEKEHCSEKNHCHFKPIFFVEWVFQQIQLNVFLQRKCSLRVKFHLTILRWRIKIKNFFVFFFFFFFFFFFLLKQRNWWNFTITYFNFSSLIFQTERRAFFFPQWRSLSISFSHDFALLTRE